jgi:hypothetical protein
MHSEERRFTSQALGEKSEMLEVKTEISPRSPFALVLVVAGLTSFGHAIAEDTVVMMGIMLQETCPCEKCASVVAYKQRHVV